MTVFTLKVYLLLGRAVDLAIAVDISADVTVCAVHAPFKVDVRRGLVNVVGGIFVGQVEERVCLAISVGFPSFGVRRGFAKACFADTSEQQTDSSTLEVACSTLFGRDRLGNLMLHWEGFGGLRDGRIVTLVVAKLVIKHVTAGTACRAHAELLVLAVASRVAGITAFGQVMVVSDGLDGEVVASR